MALQDGRTPKPPKRWARHQQPPTIRNPISQAELVCLYLAATGSCPDLPAQGECWLPPQPNAGSEPQARGSEGQPSPGSSQGRVTLATSPHRVPDSAFQGVVGLQHTQHTGRRGAPDARHRTPDKVQHHGPARREGQQPATALGRTSSPPLPPEMEPTPQRAPARPDVQPTPVLTWSTATARPQSQEASVAFVAIKLPP